MPGRKFSPKEVLEGFAMDSSGGRILPKINLNMQENPPVMEKNVVSFGYRVKLA